MKPKEKMEFVKMLMWAINKMDENNPEIEMCFNEVRECAAIAWYELTGIDVR